MSHHANVADDRRTSETEQEKKVERRVTLRTCLPFGTCEVKKSDSTEFLKKICANFAQYNKRDFVVFSEGELTFMFAICLRPFRLFVCRLSRLCLSVTLVHLLSRLKFSAMFLAVWYLGHPLTSTENFTKIVPGNPYDGGLHARRIAKYNDFGPIKVYISETM